MKYLIVLHLINKETKDSLMHTYYLDKLSDISETIGKQIFDKKRFNGYEIEDMKLCYNNNNEISVDTIHTFELNQYESWGKENELENIIRRMCKYDVKLNEKAKLEKYDITLINE